MSAQLPTIQTIELVDQNANGVTYFGTALPGTATSDAGWQISARSTSGTVDSFLWAESDASMNNIWDNRTSLAYS